MIDDAQVIFRKQFSDLDQFGEFVGTWDLFFLQLAKGGIDVHIAQLVRQRLLIEYCQLSNKVDQRGTSPEGFWTFAFAQGPKIIWRNTDVQADQIIIYSPCSEIDCVSWPGFEVVTLSVHEELLMQVCERFKHGSMSEMLKDKEVVITNPLQTRMFRQRLLNILNSTSNSVSIANQIILHSVTEVEIIEELCALLSSSAINESRVSSPLRLRAIRVAREFMDQHPSENITVSELCNVTGVSLRTLQYAFMEHLGAPPKKFINMSRLRRVHRDLLTSSPNETTITTECSKWGFWHMGQFGRDYKAVFGCLPSETLRRTL